MSACLRCGAPSQERHHPSGRIAGAYADPELAVDYCQACHDAEHAIRARLELDKGRSPASVPERIALLLRRVAVTLGRLGGASLFGPFLAALAAAMIGWAVALEVFVASLDRALPAWREVVRV